MQIAVIGAGAIGCLVGGKLAQQGHAVTLVGRPRFAATVQQAGLTIVDDAGRHTIRNVTAVGDTAAAWATATAAAPSAFDAAILTVKSYDTATALGELGAALARTNHPVPLVVSLQNGVGNEEAIAAHFDAAHTVAGTLTTPVSVPEVGVIHIDKPRFTMGLSRWSPAVDAAAFADLHDALAGAGFNVTAFGDARGMKWTKLLMNMIGNATSAILDLSPDQIFADKRLANLEIDAWREALAVMRARDIPALNVGSFPFATLAPLIRFGPKPMLRTALRRQVGDARGGKMPSLHIDLHSGKGKSEVGWLNGAVVRAGEEAGVATPVNRVLTEVLTELVRAPSQMADWRHNGERLLANVRR